MTEERTDKLEHGTVTRVSPQRRNGDRVSVYIDDEFAFGLYQETALRHGVSRGIYLSISEQEKILADDQLIIARVTALRYLGERARTTYEVRQKLKKKGFQEEVIEPVLQRMDELGYLDDSGYTAAFIQGRLASKGYGPLRIRQDLQRRGIAAPVVDAALNRLISTEQALDNAVRQAEKRWALLQKERDVRKRRKKLYDYLLRRGYDFDTVRAALDRVTANC